MSGADSTYPATFRAETVLERVLLAIINAHTTRENEGRQAERLQTAMNALIGPATADERDMTRALHHMARQRRQDACDFEMGAIGGDTPTLAARSLPDLAKQAAREIMGLERACDIQSAAGRLCAAYRAWSRPDDPVREALAAESVRSICDELAEWDIPSIRQN